MAKLDTSPYEKEDAGRAYTWEQALLSWVGSLNTRHRGFIFLDRDGVINIDRPEYIKSWQEYSFYPDALDALRWLRERQVNVILISNQSGLHRGYTKWEDFWEIHYGMLRTIREAGGDILAAFYCPHHPEEKCSCRKPSPGMILAASRLFRIPLPRTCLIGDRSTDMEAARQAGCKPVLLDRACGNAGPSCSGESHAPMLRCRTLMEAVISLKESGDW